MHKRFVHTCVCFMFTNVTVTTAKVVFSRIPTWRALNCCAEYSTAACIIVECDDYVIIGMRQQSKTINMFTFLLDRHRGDPSVNTFLICAMQRFYKPTIPSSSLGSWDLKGNQTSDPLIAEWVIYYIIYYSLGVRIT